MLGRVRGMWAAVVRWPYLAIPLAALVLVLPYATGAAADGGEWIGRQVGALAGVGAGWLLADQTAGRGIGRGRTSLIVALIAIGCVGAVFLVTRGPGPARVGALLLATGLIGGTLIRGTRRDRALIQAVLPIATVAVWLMYDHARIPFEPLRDLHLYLGAGTEALAGRPVYLAAPTVDVSDPTALPFVYPPVTIPLFELLASLPRTLVEVLWVAGTIAAVLAGLWLLGVRGRWLPLFLAWPPLALGLSVGNVATVSFFLFALGYRFGAALILSGVFKLQSAIPSLWLVRERRWRSIAVGVSILGAAILLTLPLTGVAAWPDWVAGLGHFQAMTDAVPQLKGLSLTRMLPSGVVLILTGIAVLYALAARGRTGLARFGVASVISSPTLYLHGLGPLLPGILSYRTTTVWLLLGLTAGLARYEIVWLAVAIVAIGLTRRADPLAPPAEDPPAVQDLHPLGEGGSVWPGTPHRWL